MPDLSELHPAMRRKALAIIGDLHGHGLQACVVSALRGPAEQARIYAVGRGTPGKPYTVSGITITAPTRSQYPRWAIVTRAKPFASPHQWGVAVDFAWLVNGRIQYEAPAGWWRLLDSAAEAHDCERIVKAVPWDKGHVQWMSWHIIKKHMKHCQQLWSRGGLRQVWAWLDEQP